MRSLIHAALMVGLIAAPATAAKLSPEEQLAKLTEGHVAGKPVDCIPQFPGSESRRIDRLAMAYRVGTTWYVNRFDGDCPELRYDRIVVTRSPVGKFCRGDILRLRTAYPPMDVGSCVFGAFTPYTKPRG